MGARSALEFRTDTDCMRIPVRCPETPGKRFGIGGVNPLSMGDKKTVGPLRRFGCSFDGTRNLSDSIKEIYKNAPHYKGFLLGSYSGMDTVGTGNLAATTPHRPGARPDTHNCSRTIEKKRTFLRFLEVAGGVQHDAERANFESMTFTEFAENAGSKEHM